jgi:predicted metalloendopeptidase
LLVVAPTPKQSPTSGLDLGNFDRTVRPQDDLFRAANGRWLARTPVPPDRVTHGTFVELSDKTETDLRAIIENVEAQRDRQRGTARQIADLYASLMDETRAEELGFQPITELLRRIDAIRTPRDDRGRRLDGAGAALDWWTTGDKQAFAAKAQALVEQFKAYTRLRAPGAPDRRVPIW